MAYNVLVLAAGKGQRMGKEKNKVLLEIKQTPVVIHTCQVFENDEACKGIYLVANKREIDEIQDLLTEFHITKVKQVVEGGRERQESVFFGLQAMKEESNHDPLVLIHDGARPFIKQKEITKVALSAEKMGAAILAVKVKDTIKKVSHHQVQETIDRSSLWAVQTPQAFRLSTIYNAHVEGEKRGFVVTDDASLLEQLGKPVAVVEGDYQNIKLTTPEDLILAEHYFELNHGGNRDADWTRI
ncbi:2-C-methyl-D-erythritol 4-phosphate cytidylyltransferase [Terrilactibacillus sp. BCM23-1]|uniref:2-C-methyl-D-erythritol 4-phosphate cytidylyltransferase n=1 Tax=Terrilactibacillus tamarindi TaxID=2599694 RepID=A0A6N8CUF7_9BACI|nr:2-C-methyl-D-erythritol 4-phosphate cytidylyltransferase [Terrilactibacillus tamarindi]MTT32793.1 2-C-methyl-D-erythritol 4-phosphate cytidylyltransferase [Terrilactibacillus tamarindi]